MIGKSDHIENKIYDKLKHIIDNVYIKKGISPVDAKKFLEKKRNFTELLKNLEDLKMIYDSADKEKSFNLFVSDILFKRILMDRIYYEQDNKQNENIIIKNFNTFLNN